MGRSVTLKSLHYMPVSAGVSQAPITAADVRKMSASVFRVDPRAKLEASVPEGSDGYLFMLTGEGKITVGGAEKPFECESFATIGEKNTFSRK